MYRIAEKIKQGIKLFPGHNEDNSTENRKSVGEILTTFTKEVGGKLRTIAIAAMDKAKAIKYDVCSIEASIFEDGGIVHDVENVTGLAVGNSAQDTPAFSNAGRLTMVQAFTGVKEKSGEENRMDPITLQDLLSIPLSLLRESIKVRQVHPNQIFELKEIEDDREFGPIIQKKTQLEKTVEEQEKAIKEKDDLIATKDRNLANVGAEKLLEEAVNGKDAGLTDAQKNFIVGRFNAENLEKVDKEAIEKYIQKEKDEFADMAELFGVKDSSNNSSGGKGNSSSENKNEDENAGEGATELDAAFSKLD